MFAIMASSILRDRGEPSVLCVIDFSASSENALRSAVHLASGNQTHLTVLHPYRLTQAVKKEDLVKLKRDIDEEAALNFKKMSHLLINLNVPFDFRAEVGFLTDRVQEHLRKNNVTLLVMNKHLALGSWEAFHELIDQLEIPMMIVPENKSMKI